MSLSEFEVVYSGGCAGELYGKDLRSKLEKIEFDAFVEAYIVVEFNRLQSEYNAAKLDVLTKAAYVYRSSCFVEPIVDLLYLFLRKTDDDMFMYLAEIDSLFTVLGLLRNEESIDVLNLYAKKELYWDDLFNINKSAIFAIEKIGGDKATCVIRDLIASCDNEVIRDAAVSSLYRIDAKNTNPP
ncbi:MAG: HEAT repeat domain-containing protein [Marinagarivorans sp.]